MSSSFQGDTITKCVNVESKRLHKNKPKINKQLVFFTLKKQDVYLNPKN